MRICTVEGCERKHDSKGFCKRHYGRHYRKTEYGKSVIRRYERTEKRKVAQKVRGVIHRQTNVSEWKKAKRKSDRNQYLKFPEKIRARSIAKRAIKREECEIVNCNELGERHHDDYSKPLEVKFLCSSHHREFHVMA